VKEKRKKPNPNKKEEKVFCQNGCRGASLPRFVRRRSERVSVYSYPTNTLSLSRLFYFLAAWTLEMLRKPLDDISGEIGSMQKLSLKVKDILVGIF
ncbi:hypothetical protein PRUPE_8G125700, partial [Prunus persica]